MCRGTYPLTPPLPFTRHRLVVDAREAAQQARRVQTEPGRDAVEAVLGEGEERRREARDREAQCQGQRGPRREAEVARRDAHPDGGDGQEVGADRHRADDQDRVVVDHAVTGDHAGDEHECQVARERPRVRPRRAEDLGPHQARLGRPPGERADHLRPRQGDVGVGHPLTAERLQQWIHRARPNGGRHHGGAPRRVDEPDRADAVNRVERLRDGRHRRRPAEDLEGDHRRMSWLIPDSSSSRLLMSSVYSRARSGTTTTIAMPKTMMTQCRVVEVAAASSTVSVSGSM